VGSPDQSALVQSVALIAMTDLVRPLGTACGCWEIFHLCLEHSVTHWDGRWLWQEDEELLLNYRLNPRVGALPPWYHPVDQDEDRRRWA
jgi:hypothetical protein